MLWRKVHGGKESKSSFGRLNSKMRLALLALLFGLFVLSCERKIEPAQAPVVAAPEDKARVPSQPSLSQEQAKKAVEQYFAKLAANDLSGAMKLVGTPFLSSHGESDEFLADTEAVRKSIEPYFTELNELGRFKVKVTGILARKSFVSKNSDQLATQERALLEKALKDSEAVVTVSCSIGDSMPWQEVLLVGLRDNTAKVVGHTFFLNYSQAYYDLPVVKGKIPSVNIDRSKDGIIELSIDQEGKLLSKLGIVDAHGKLIAMREDILRSWRTAEQREQRIMMLTRAHKEATIKSVLDGLKLARRCGLKNFCIFREGRQEVAFEANIYDEWALLQDEFIGKRPAPKFGFPQDKSIEQAPASDGQSDHFEFELLLTANDKGRGKLVTSATPSGLSLRKSKMKSFSMVWDGKANSWKAAEERLEKELHTNARNGKVLLSCDPELKWDAVASLFATCIRSGFQTSNIWITLNSLKK